MKLIKLHRKDLSPEFLNNVVFINLNHLESFMDSETKDFYCLDFVFKDMNWYTFKFYKNNKDEMTEYVETLKKLESFLI